MTERLVKKILNKLIKGERGFALPLVLILLLVGGLIISPLLSYVSTGLIVGKNQEQLMERLYAADAGVEDALWHLISENVTVPAGGSVDLTESTVNGASVNVTIEDKGDLVYKITSVATGSASSNTTLEVYIRSIDFSYFLDNAITSEGEVTFQPGATANGTVSENYTGEWPTALQMRMYYLRDVEGVTPFASSTLDIKDYPTILPSGPLYREGDLGIINTGTAGDNATLNGTVYVTGNLDIGMTNKAFTLNLNDQTIFVEGDIRLGTKCTLAGSGCVIAVGDINFGPDIDSDPVNFIFVMSIEGIITLNPQSDFYGSIAGNIEVQLQPSVDVTWKDWSNEDLNFPTGVIEIFEILAWKVSP